MLLMTLLFTQQSARDVVAEAAGLLAGRSRGGAAGGRVCTRRPACCNISCSDFILSARRCCRRLRKIQKSLQGANFWMLLLLIAVVPAVCEELAFRGFILSGFRHLGSKRRAIVYSALLFGVAHGILQQSLIASLVGHGAGIRGRAKRQHPAVHGLPFLPQRVGHRQQPDHAEHVSRLADVAGVRHSRQERRMYVHLAGDRRRQQWPAYLLLAWFSRLSAGRSPEEARPLADERRANRCVVARLRKDAV